MAHYNASVDTSRPPAEMFADLSDFSSTQEWDPGVIEAERLGDAPVREGTEFRLLASFLHRKIPLTDSTLLPWSVSVTLRVTVMTQVVPAGPAQLTGTLALVPLALACPALAPARPRS